jgi:hypothetical protein
MNLNRNLRLTSVGLGVWVVISSLILWRSGSAVSVNGWITGVIVILSSLMAIRVPNARFVSTAAGVWLVASLFAWPDYSSPAVWNNAMIGAVVALVSLVGPKEVDMIAS